jgi:hypothetical protein
LLVNKSRNRVERNKRDAAQLAALADADEPPIAAVLALIIEGARESEERITFSGLR